MPDNAPPPLPQRNCDVVMKGGITSGIVYPEALHELSKKYRFRSIGGTSAGAIAAAATAAAELGRSRNKPDAFDRLAELPTRLSEPIRTGGPSRLFSLFQPQPATAPIFNSFVAALGRKTMVSRLWAFAIGVVSNFLPQTLGVLFVCGLVAGGWFAFNLVFGGLIPALASLLPALLLSIIVVTVVLAIVFALKLVRSVPTNLFGLCTGFSKSGAASQDPPLTAWLYRLFNDLAGQPLVKPVTFGDLWWPEGRAEKASEEEEPSDPAIRLHMMTTSLTHGRPYRLPFLDNEQRIFFFKEEEFEKLFPDEVLKWMKDHARKREGDKPEYPGFIALPLASDLPIIVGVRMSLSFPFLISAVPLYAVDRTAGSDRQPERVWFSDGGIASNFPVHFFDGPLPRWPTLAINLRPYNRHYPDGHVYKPRNNNQGQVEWWTEIDQGSDWVRLKSFLSAIPETMQNWMDNTQLKLSGYRDRVVHVSLKDDQGGMNLNMPKDLITLLGARGRDAAKMVMGDLEGKDRGGKPVEVTWDNHRWVRFRTYMALLEKEFGSVARAMSHAEPGDRSYDDLIRRDAGSEPTSYPMASVERKTAAVEALRSLERLAREWETKIAFMNGAPHPKPELRVRPRI